MTYRTSSCLSILLCSMYQLGSNLRFLFLIGREGKTGANRFDDEVKRGKPFAFCIDNTIATAVLSMQSYKSVGSMVIIKPIT